MMPDINGFDVVEALQRDLLTANIPIVIVTAKSVTADDRCVLANNAETVVEILEKSTFNRSEFVAEVRRAIRQPAGRR
jgi:CheY-like chemotaxis protein